MMKGKSEENSAIQATFVLRATELLCRRQQRERKSFSFVLFFITLGVWLWCFLVLRVVPSLFRQLNEPAFGGAGIIARTYFRCHWEIDKKWQKPFPSSRRPVSLNRASNWFGFFIFLHHLYDALNGFIGSITSGARKDLFPLPRRIHFQNVVLRIDRLAS